MILTLVVLKLDKSNDCNEEQLFIFSTFIVLKLDKSNDCNEE